MPLVVALPPAVLVACAALLATVVCLWCRPAWLWAVPLTIAVVAAYGSGIMHGPAGAWILLLGGALSAYRRPGARWIRACAAAAVAAAVLLLAVRALPGFDNPIVVPETVLSPGAPPYRQHLNFDKTLAGILVLAGGVALLRTWRGWTATARQAAPIALATLVVVLLASFTLGYVRFDSSRLDLGWTPVFWVWAPINLLTTCVSEEAFFRAFFQRETALALEGRPYATPIAVGASAVLFGLAHAAGGWRYVLLATLAGAGYAIAFQRTGRVEAAILTHFTVNATHFLLFTYPALG